MTTKRRTTIFVNGLDDQITKEILYQTFLPFGEINDVEIPMDPKKRKSLFTS
jgi:RNA recognition motif-containing protein